jgi:hypothetical protein
VAETTNVIRINSHQVLRVIRVSPCAKGPRLSDCNWSGWK